MQSKEDPSRLLNRTEVERRFGVKARYLELAASRGDGPQIVRIGRSVYYRISDVRSWIATLAGEDDPAGAAK